MRSYQWKALMGSPIACYIFAIIMPMLSILAIVFNVYNACGGSIADITELKSYIGTNEIIIAVMGIVLFAFFMRAAKVAKKSQKQ